MDEIRERHERTAGQTFIDWYNQQHRTTFKLIGRSAETPNLAFLDGDRELRAEVATAYYDFIESKIWWMHARNTPDATGIRPGSDVLRMLTRSINQEIAGRCSGDPGADYVLLIYVLPTVTTATNMREALESLVLPERNPFEGIYLVGQFTRSKHLGSPELSVRTLV